MFKILVFPLSLSAPPFVLYFLAVKELYIRTQCSLVWNKICTLDRKQPVRLTEVLGFQLLLAWSHGFLTQPPWSPQYACWWSATPLTALVSRPPWFSQRFFLLYAFAQKPVPHSVGCSSPSVSLRTAPARLCGRHLHHWAAWGSSSPTWHIADAQ